MYEVEFKIELTAQEKEELLISLEKRSFPLTKVTQQNDFYIHAEKSPYGGYDLKRYRDERDKCIYTEKLWEVVDGEKARKENEHEVAREDFASKIAEFPNAVKIKKERQWFAGKTDKEDVSITIDSVKFDHSPEMRYFLEAEIDTEEKDKVKETKEAIRMFLQELLGKSEIVEAPGMFTMAFEGK